MKQLLLLAISLVTLTSVATAQDRTSDEKAIRDIVTTMENGWLEKSGEKFASGFAETHDYIVWNGYYFANQSRKANAENHQMLFNGPFRGLNAKFKVDKIRFIGDVAIVHVLGATFPIGQPVPENPGVLITLVLEKKNNDWKIVSFHNLDLEAFTDKEIGERIPMPAKVMYAGWYR